jgi:hypothetical protein
VNAFASSWKLEPLLRQFLIYARGLFDLLRSCPLRQADPGSLAGKFSNVIDSELTWQLRKEFVRLRRPLPSRLPRGGRPPCWSTDLLTNPTRPPRSTGAEEIQPEASLLGDERFQRFLVAAISLRRFESALLAAALA